MAHAAAIDPIVLGGLLLGAVSMVGWTIERMAMGRVPHPIAARRGRRARGGVTGNKRLPRRSGRRHRLPRCRGCGCGFARSLLKCRRRLDAADLINSIMK